MRVMITGGAGFIGSHTVQKLLELGHHCVVVDNLANGHADAVPRGTLIIADVRDTDCITRILIDHEIEAIVHFAALIEAGASVSDPLRFWDNNVGGTLSILKAMQWAGVDKLVYSSTAALYGNPERLPIMEDDVQHPSNPYGDTKLAGERAIAAAGRAHGIRAACLRYFNAAGADPQGRLGERHNAETHLIPLALMAAAGNGPPLTIYGTDYPTADGTCIRDYIHVTDLADAHVKALEYLATGKTSRAFNVGCGVGWSVRQVIDTVGLVTGRNVPLTTGPRRAGDPVSLIASNQRATIELGWAPRFPKLGEMVDHAWAYYRESHR